MAVEATLPNRWALAAGRSASKGCVICRGPRLPGARLCGPCKAALKRARLETVSELIPRPSRAALEAPEVRRRAKEAAAVRVAKRPQRRWLIPGFCLAAALLCAGGYLAWHVARPGHEAPAAAAGPPVPRINSQAATPVARAESVARDTNSAGKPAAEAPTPHPPPRPGATAQASRAAAKRAVAAPALPSALPVDRFAVVAPREAPTAQPAPEPVLPVREAPAPDRWQVMTDQIARCGREGFFAGVICEQRVRIKYCEGYWGSAPQCPSGIANDHGG